MGALTGLRSPMDVYKCCGEKQMQSFALFGLFTYLYPVINNGMPY
jgi:hypothetical protein